MCTRFVYSAYYIAFKQFEAVLAGRTLTCTKAHTHCCRIKASTMACRIASGSCRSAWFAVARWSAGPTSSLHGHTFCAAAPETPVKYALIQGSSRGIGLQIVTQLLERPEYRCGAPRVTGAHLVSSHHTNQPQPGAMGPRPGGPRRARPCTPAAPHNTRPPSAG